MHKGFSKNFLKFLLHRNRLLFLGFGGLFSRRRFAQRIRLFVRFDLRTNDVLTRQSNDYANRIAHHQRDEGSKQDLRGRKIRKQPRHDRDDERGNGKAPGDDADYRGKCACPLHVLTLKHQTNFAPTLTSLREQFALWKCGYLRLIGELSHVLNRTFESIYVLDKSHPVRQTGKEPLARTPVWL